VTHYRPFAVCLSRERWLKRFQNFIPQRRLLVLVSWLGWTPAVPRIPPSPHHLTGVDCTEVPVPWQRCITGDTLIHNARLLLYATSYTQTKFLNFLYTGRNSWLIVHTTSRIAFVYPVSYQTDTARDFAGIEGVASHRHVSVARCLWNQQNWPSSHNESGLLSIINILKL
jgi:hypothetical protein